ncbi:MAG: hypothetical protein ABIP51_02655 [Bacteroidia bacterium]
MSWFVIVLIITVILRGMGAGIITGVTLITLPARRRLGILQFANFMRVHYKEKGVKVYAATTIVGFILTIVLCTYTFKRSEPVIVSSAIVTSLIATVLGLVGTAGAFPAMINLWKLEEDDLLKLTSFLNRFAGWSIFSAIFHTISFVILIVALPYTSH